MDDRNKLHHIFGNPRHGLEPLVRQCGSVTGAWRLMYEAVTAAHRNGSLEADARGYYRQLFEIAGYPVTISGSVFGDVVHIGTAWIAT